MRRRFARRPLLAAAWSAFGARAVAVAADPEPRIEPLVRLPRAAVPPGQLLLAAARLVIPPGVAVATATPAGLRALAVEAGLVSVKVAMPGRRLLAHAGDAANAGALEDILVVPGHALSLPATAIEGLRNPGLDPAVLVDTVLFPAAPEPPPPAFISGSGVEFRLLGAGVMTAAPRRAEFVLNRIDLPPAAVVPVALTRGIALALVDGGRFVLMVERGAAEVAIAAAGIGPAAAPRSVRAGDGRTLPAGSAAFVPAGGAIRLAVAGPSPGRLLLVTLRAA